MKTYTIPEILQQWELGLIPKDSKVTTLETAQQLEAKIAEALEIIRQARFDEFGVTLERLRGYLAGEQTK